eukprot:5538584-Amphidinium_carterae.1
MPNLWWYWGGGDSLLGGAGMDNQLHMKPLPNSGCGPLVGVPLTSGQLGLGFSSGSYFLVLENWRRCHQVVTQTQGRWQVGHGSYASRFATAIQVCTRFMAINLIAVSGLSNKYNNRSPLRCTFRRLPHSLRQGGGLSEGITVARMHPRTSKILRHHRPQPKSAIHAACMNCDKISFKSVCTLRLEYYVIIMKSSRQVCFLEANGCTSQWNLQPMLPRSCASSTTVKTVMSSHSSLVNAEHATLMFSGLAPTCRRHKLGRTETSDPPPRLANLGMMKRRDTQMLCLGHELASAARVLFSLPLAVSLAQTVL